MLVYHYCAVTFSTPGQMKYQDGVVEARQGLSPQDLAKLREDIAAKYEPPVAASKVTILHVSQIG